MLLKGRKVFVGRFVPKSESQNSNGKDRCFTNVYGGGIGLKLMYKMGFQPGKGLGKHLNGITKPIEVKKRVGLHGLGYKEEGMGNEKMLYVARAQRKGERQEQLKRQFEELRQKRVNRYKGINAYDRNLDESIDDKRLQREFSAFDKISSAKVMCDNLAGRSRGFGFVCFSTPEEAQKANNEMNNRIVDTKPLYVALAQTKEERKAYLNTQFIQNNTSIRAQPMAMAHSHHPPQMPPHPQFIQASIGPPIAYAAQPSHGYQSIRITQKATKSMAEHGLSTTIAAAVCSIDFCLFLWIRFIVVLKPYFNLVFLSFYGLKFFQLYEKFYKN